MGSKFGFSKIVIGLAVLVTVGSVTAKADGGIVIGKSAELTSAAVTVPLKMVVEHQYGIRAFNTIDQESLPVIDGDGPSTIRYRFNRWEYMVQFEVYGKLVDGVWQFKVVRTDEADGVVGVGSPVEFSLAPGQSTTLLFKKWVSYMQQNFRITFSL